MSWSRRRAWGQTWSYCSCFQEDFFFQEGFFLQEDLAFKEDFFFSEDFSDQDCYFFRASPLLISLLVYFWGLIFHVLPLKLICRYISSKISWKASGASLKKVGEASLECCASPAAAESALLSICSSAHNSCKLCHMEYSFYRLYHRENNFYHSDVNLYHLKHGFRHLYYMD